MKPAATRTIIISIIVSVVLAVACSIVYFNDHAWGAWGDDSPGYIYLAGLMYQGKPLVYNDQLAAAGLEYFGDEKLARWLTPTHHQFINPRGVIASKYPIGISLVMVAAAKVLGSDNAFYYVVPFMAVANVVLVYLIGLLFFQHSRYRHLIGFLAGAFMGAANLYYDYAIAQPMREIPSMFFMLVTVLATLAAVYCSPLTGPVKRLRWAITFTIIAGLSFGMAFNIRETSAMILPAIVLYVVWALWQKRSNVKKNVRNIAPYAVAFACAVVIGVLPTVFNSIAISHEKEAFKARDKSDIAVLSNINHIDSLSIQNVFNSEGKFSPDSGSLPHYISILGKASPVPYFLIVVLIGIWYLWRESKPKAVFLVLWGLGVLSIFSLWVNPYARYILPMFPAVMLLGAYGITALLEQFLPKVLKRRFVHIAASIAVVCTFLVAYIPTIQQIRDNLQTDIHLFKAISRSDLDTLRTLANVIRADGGERAVLMFSGEWQYGTSETLEAHTGVKTVRFPLEQRFDFNESQTYAFIEEELITNRSLYVWVDETASDELTQWFKKYDTELIQEYVFSFEEVVKIYRVQLPESDTL